MRDRVLVHAPHWLGDAVMATPFLKRLAALTPGTPVDVLAKPSVAEVFRRAPGVAEVLILSQKNPGFLARHPRSRFYATAYILPRSFSSALLCRVAGIPQRIGYAGDGRSPLLTRALPLDPRFHYVRRYLGLLGEEGAQINFRDLHVPKASEEETQIFLKKRGFFGRGKILAVAPGSRAPARRWFPERFAGVIDGWPAPCDTIVLMGAPEDRPYAEEVARLSRRPVLNFCGETSIPLAASLLSRCTALLTNESGLMHVGWAVGVPLVVVAGPSNIRLTSPFGTRVKILQTDRVPCVPCVKNTCSLSAKDQNLCLRMIETPEVLSALSAVAQ